MTGLDREVRQGLGMHLRRLRQAQALTLAALAEQVGVTASALSQIERGTSEPSLGTLWRLGRALNASLFDFFAGQEAPAVDVTRAGDRTVVAFERFRYEVMARSAQRGIDLFTLRLEPGEGPVRDPVSHAGEEAGMVVEGAMEVIVAGATYRLGPGDAIWFVSGQPHTFAAVGDVPCLSVWADTIPDHAAPGGARSVFDGYIAASEAPADGRKALGPRRSERLDPLAAARALPLDTAYLREVVDRLAALGSSPLGFRVTGTPEDRAAAEYAAGELRAAGLGGVAVEEVAVDGWRFRGAELAPAGGPAIEGAALGGTPATPRRGVTGRLVDAGAARRRELDRLDVRGALVLVDWHKGPAGPADIGLELGLRGAAGMIVAPAAGGPYFQAEGALGGFDGHWHADAPPMMTIRKRDAAALRERLAAGPARGDAARPGRGDAGRRGPQRRRLPRGRRARADRHRGAPRRLVPRRVRQRHGRGGTPRHRAGARRDGVPPAPPPLLHLAHRRGVRPARPRGRLVRGRLAPGQRHPSRVGRGGAVPPVPGGERPPRPADDARGPARAGGLGAAGRPRRRGRGLADLGLADARADHRHRGLAADGGRRARGHGLQLGDVAFARTVYHTPLDTPAIVDFDHLERLTRFYALPAPGRRPRPGRHPRPPAPARAS